MMDTFIAREADYFDQPSPGCQHAAYDTGAPPRRKSEKVEEVAEPVEKEVKQF